MQIKSIVLSSLSIALLSAGYLAQAAEAPYYNPTNLASPTGKTLGYELFRTIGCPGRPLLDVPCPVPVAPVVVPVVVVPPPPAMVQVQAKAAPIVTIPDSDGDGIKDDKDRCPNTPTGAMVDEQGCELDGDKDGVVDRLDQCLTTPAGRAVNAQGCELDGDKDGVVDALDQCPTTPAGRVVNEQGCELDGDKDGVVDALDQCPTTPAGRAVNEQGCELDGDKDSIIDAQDQCPDTPLGDRVDSKGCSIPKVFNLVGVNFDNGKDILRAESAAILDEAVSIMKRYPGLNIEIAGHADSNGGDEDNLSLSERRARAVVTYLLEHGVEASRMSAKGYGETMPISDNSTPAGRFKNRRVELLSLN